MMRAPILLLLIAMVRKPMCAGFTDLHQTTNSTFGPASIDFNANEGEADENDKDIESCGLYRDGGTLMYGDIKANYIDYSWMVALYRRRSSRRCKSKSLETTSCWKYTAGGSLINMNVVLTAAHIVLGSPMNALKARAGDWDLDSILDKERLVKKIIIHKHYIHSTNPVEVEYDAALLVLATPYTKADNLVAICLPPPDLVFSTNCKTAGRRKTRHYSTENNLNILKVVDLDVVDSDTCSGSLTKESKQRVRVHESFVCAASDKDKDSCQGDGGSPLMCSDNMEKLALLKLVSVSYLCNAGRVHNNSDASAVSGSEESEGVIEDVAQCGEIKFSNSGTDSKYPWMVALFATVNENQQCSLTDNSCWSITCGGSLIGPKVVLLTGHCVYRYRQDQMKVRAGDWNLDAFEEHPYQERLVKEVIVHPQYQDTRRAYERRNDVGLVVVESPFTLADNIAFICLPPPDLNFAAASCKAIGWNGQIEISNGSLAQKENHYYARGLHSWSVDYTSTHVYADVVKFRNWIDQTMRANDFSTDTYTNKA